MNWNGESNQINANNVYSFMDYIPMITYAGDEDLFHTLSYNLITSIITDSIEWRRSYDRPIKQVRLKASFVPFRNDIPSEGDFHLINKPILHTYWTECSDTDVYKSTVREDIDNWLKTLSKCKVQDWMIILVETYDLKKTNKLLPRTTVLDKIRSDFASKHGDRCLSIINPIKSESRSAESWRGLINRMRVLILISYDKSLLRFEEIIRDYREKRNIPGWNFCHYFLLQEELAFILEILGLYDEALVQYDELDALFTQFVLNSNVSDSPKWLSSFQAALNNWNGVNLENSNDYRMRVLLSECTASLLDFRSYLFSRQCTMLIALKKPGEIAHRCLTFINDIVNELRILEIQKPEGAIECWAFLCALEVLNACESLTSTIDNNQLLDSCSLHTASLWALARDKLESLGKLCGLMPGSNPTSEQLHTVVYLIAGMGDSVSLNQDSKKPTPTDKLKWALSSKEAFKKQYLEYTELAMGTYKHVGRIRSARLIGKELARFYSELDENQKAIVFLLDALKTYTDESWPHLASQTMRELAQCYKKMDDVERYVKMCAAISCMTTLHMAIRNSYFDEMLGYLQIPHTQETLITELSHCFTLIKMKATVSDKVIQDCVVNVEIVLISLFPRKIKCSFASLSVEQVQKSIKRRGVKHADLPTDLLLQCQISDTSKLSNIGLLAYPAYSKIIIKEDKSINSANVDVCRIGKALKRSDSVKHRKPSINIKGNFNEALNCKEIILHPGINTFTVSKNVADPGFYKSGQLSLIIEKKIEFLSTVLEPRLCYQVAKTPPKIILKSMKDLIAGLPQIVELHIFSGSISIPLNSKLKLKTSRGLKIIKYSNKNEIQFFRELEVLLPACSPFETNQLYLTIFAELPPKKDSLSMQHNINIQCPWQIEENIVLHFGAPLMSNMKLYTAKFRKFLQIIVTGLSSQKLQLTEPTITSSTSTDLHFKALNPTAGQKLIIGNSTMISFIWEIAIDKNKDKPIIPIKIDFRVKYFLITALEEFQENSKDDDPLHIHNLQRIDKESHVYWCNFDLTDYMTHFIVTSKVEVSGSSGEFCRAGSICHLSLTVGRVNQNNAEQNIFLQLMYEVLADQTMWAVCGRTAGIISFEVVDKQSVTLDVMPLTSGYLPLPAVRLSKYIPAATDYKNDSTRKNEVGCAAGPRLEPFSPGQVYNASKALQVHVLPAATVPFETA